MTRTFALLIALCAAVALLRPAPSTAQNDPDQPATAEPEQKEYRGPLPTHFGKLGIGDAQREELYAIHGEYAEKIAALEKQITALEAERDTRLESLLTPGQKLRLKELREEAARRDAEEKESADAEVVEEEAE